MQNLFDRLPRNVLEDVFWAFRGNRFDDHAEFTTQVREYQRRIRGKTAGVQTKPFTASSVTRISGHAGVSDGPGQLRGLVVDGGT